MGIDAILALAGLLAPPAFDFIKKKFLSTGTDTPEATASTLATTNPEVLPQYVSATGELLKVRVEYFNRDVVGQPSQWVVDLRAAIRPVSVVIGFLLLGLEMSSGLSLEPGTRGAIITNNASWFGSRLI